ncbi:MAG: DUF6488 family protein [Rhodoferax sp.]|nr:DUF6488 family protein [Rhodoferax sp.]
MKKFVSLSALVTTMAMAPAAFAAAGSSCHFHGNAPIKEAILVGCASEYKDGLASKGKIDPSWKGAKVDKAETVEGKSMKEWKFTFKNPAEKDATKQTLYLFYSLNGNFIAANFTGK